jgi:solute carrier family 30 (zinc transporter), member 5/7
LWVFEVSRFGRIEVLAAFVNCTLLIYAAFSIVVEAIERLFMPAEIDTENLLTVAVIGLLVNLVGVFVFQQHHHHHSHSRECSHHGHHSHSEQEHDALFHGMYLHVLADALGSLGVIVSSLLIQYYGWLYADSICSLFISALIVTSVWPLLKHCVATLLQATPDSIYNNNDHHGSGGGKLNEFYHGLMSIQGITSYHDVHFWELAAGAYVCTLTVIIGKDSDEQQVRSAVQQHILTLIPQIRKLSIQIERNIINI